MTDSFEISRPDPSTLMVRLKKPEMLDPAVFGRIENDTYLLPCTLSDPRRGILIYTTEQLVPLRALLEQYSFSQTEGYQFLISLLKKAASVNRTKPVLLSLDTIFCTPYGDEIYFASVPVALEYWMFQKDDNERLVQEICGNFITGDAYEIIGYLIRLCSSENFSLLAAAQGLEDLESAYYPRSFWQRNRPYPPFRAKRAIREKGDWSFCETAQVKKEVKNSGKMDIHTQKTGSKFSERWTLQSRQEDQISSSQCGRAAPESEKAHPSLSLRSCSERQDETGKSSGIQSGIPLSENRTADIRSSCRQENDFRTRILIPDQAKAWIDFGSERFSLLEEETGIGRHPDNPICLKDPDVSGWHARILHENGRYYIVAYQSTNGTWLNDHPVRRKMRLKEGMILRISSREGVFHEQTLSV